MKNFSKILILVFLCCLSAAVKAQPRMSSYPAASATIYLDFDGHFVQYPFWNGSHPIACAPSGLTAEKINEIFHRVAEDFRPFDINITTDSTVFLNAPLNQRMRVIVTPTSAWSPGVGGIAYIGSFTWGDDAPAFVFTDRLNNNSKYIAECITHETGHTIGLSHQSTYDSNCQLIETYAMGTGTGETSWAPVMGNSYYRNMTGWNSGPTPYGCGLVQDNLTIITTINGFGYRADDYSNEVNESATALAPTFSIDGIISTNTDRDMFRYDNPTAGSVHLEAKPFGLNNSNNGANLDVQIEIFDASGNRIALYNPQEKMNVVIDTFLQAGTYYFAVSGAGNTNINNYGSLGSYTLTGAKGALPIRSITLTGFEANKMHNLRWNIVADEPIENITIEYSTDGSQFQILTEVPAHYTEYSYRPAMSGNIFYRIKVRTVIHENGYSNTFVLKGNENTRLATVSTLVRDQIVVQSTETYRYILTDVNGRILSSGNGNAGAHLIRMGNHPSGMYILKMVSQSQKQVERIIKQ